MWSHFVQTHQFTPQTWRTGRPHHTLTHTPSHLNTPTPPPTRNEERAQFEKLLVQKLREIMLQVDLEEVNSRMVRQEVEKEMSMQLTEYKGFLDIQMLRIFGQMERPSKIHDYLYLVRSRLDHHHPGWFMPWLSLFLQGSEWNASNLDELKELGCVTYIASCNLCVE